MKRIAGMKARPPTLKAALIGVDHPHSPHLLRLLQNLCEVSGILVWSGDAGSNQPPAWTSNAKIELVTEDLTALLARPDLDFAVVSVRTDRVAQIATQVVRARKPLIIDKPAGLNSTEILQLGTLARRLGIKAAVFYGQRSHPAVLEARNQIAAGAIGRVLTVEARIITTQVRFRDPQSWLFRRTLAGGGILSWLGCHYLDLIPYVVGEEIVAVSAQCNTLSGEKIDVEDVATLTFRFKSGALGTLHTGYLLTNRGTGYRNPGGFDNYLAWHGLDGRIVWRGVTSRSLRIETAPAHRLRYRLPKTDSYGGAVGEAFLRQFLATLRSEANLPATLEDALRVMRVMEAAQRSARTQRTELIKI